MTIIDSIRKCEARLEEARVAAANAKAKLESARLELKQARATAARAKRPEVKAVLKQLERWTQHVGVYCNDIYVSTAQVPVDVLLDWRLCDTRYEGPLVYTTFRNGSGIIVCNTYDPRLPI